MTRPEDLFEAASYDLNQFRERRMAERRSMARDTPDRRRQPTSEQPVENQDSSGSGAAQKTN